MLNPFPNTLTYAFVVLMVLRITTAIYFIYIGQHILHNHKNIEDTNFPLIGKPKKWMAYLSGSLTLVISFLLFVGLATQWAAIGGMIVALKHAVVLKKYRAIRPLPISTYLLLAVVCLTLFISGAGAFAFDLPL